MNLRSFHNGKVQLHAGDCMEVLREFPDNSIDAVCTDPPYHLTSIVKRFGAANAAPAKGNAAFIRASRGFMGKVWDGGDIAFTPELWAEVLRVLKPGGHMVCFGGTRTYHRMACAIEDAGFEIRDQLAWTYGSGFPKSHSVSLAIDKMNGANHRAKAFNTKGRGHRAEELDANGREFLPTYEPTSEEAQKWSGFGTALKPAWEPICLARKPLSEGTVAANVLRWGTGAINVDKCRIETAERWDATELPNAKNGVTWGGSLNKVTSPSHPLGRFPANLIHDGSPEVLAGFPETSSSIRIKGGTSPNPMSWGSQRADANAVSGHADSGSAARFFYTAKADADDRLNSKHPTVKPVDLMQWLVRLVCPKKGVCLDPFAGTGTTGAAAFIEGCRAVLIEREAEYLADIERRMELLLSGPDERARKLAKAEPCESLPLFGVA